MEQATPNPADSAADPSAPSEGAAPYREPAVVSRDDSPASASNPKIVRSEWAAAGLAALSGALYFLGFAGFEVWPLALVSLVPLLIALRGRSGWRAMRLGWLMGFVTNAGGFYWIVPMLRTFSGFPTAVCALFSTL